MKPDRNNYEVWLVDYLDGKLDEEQTRQLMLFLDLNPDLKEEMADTENIKLQVDLSFDGRNGLKKSVNNLPSDQFELLCIASAEGDTNEEQERELAEIISADNEKMKIAGLFKKTRLVPPEIKYPKKSALKHLTLTQKITRISIAASGIAAGIAMFLILNKGSENNSGVSQPGLNQPILLSAEKITSPLENVIAQVEVSNSSTYLKQNHNTVKTVANLSPKTTFDSVPVNVNPPTVNSIEISRNEIQKTNYIADLGVSVDKTVPLANLQLTSVDPEAFFEKPGINEYFARLVREKILKAKIPETGTLKGYEVASAGIIGINRLLGWDMSLRQNRNAKGELKSLYFSSKMIKFNTPVKKTLASL